MYPKASTPIMPGSYEAANERARRWMQRCVQARLEVARLRRELAELRESINER